MSRKKQNKTIIICIPSLTFGGAETQAFLLAKGLKKYYNVIMLGFNKAEKLTTELDNEGIEWILYDFDFGIFAKKGLKKHITLLKFAHKLRKLKANTIIPYTIYPNIICNISGFIARIKNRFWNQRGIDTQQVSLIERLAIKLKPIVVSNSIGGMDSLIKRWEKPECNIQIIRNGALLKPVIKSGIEWRKELGISSDEIVMIQVANYFPEKDHSTVLRAVEILKDEGITNFKLIFVGRSSTNYAQKTVKADAFDMKLQDYVIFIDNSRDVLGLIDASDICILSSTSEGCPNAVLEYMLMKKPVVATRISGITEILGSKNEFLFNPGNEELLSSHLIRLMKDIVLRDSAGEENYDNVLQNYNTERMIKQYLKIIENGK
jgi:glycosyltransferase involved in cell wall biosynthesis